MHTHVHTERPSLLPQQKDAHSGSIRIQAPVQLDIPEDMPVDQAIAALKALGLRPPLLVKPLWTDGREGSHGLAVVHDMASMRRLLQVGPVGYSTWQKRPHPRAHIDKT